MRGVGPGEPSALARPGQDLRVGDVDADQAARADRMAGPAGYEPGLAVLPRHQPSPAPDLHTASRTRPDTPELARLQVPAGQPVTAPAPLRAADHMALPASALACLARQPC
jgi:hypothetical protein